MMLFKKLIVLFLEKWCAFTDRYMPNLFSSCRAAEASNRLDARWGTKIWESQPSAWSRYLELSEELGALEEEWLAAGGSYVCYTHGRHIPCRPCLREEGFYDRQRLQD